MITDRIETLLGKAIDKNVNETFNGLNDEKKFDGDVGIQNKMAQKICDEIIKTKEFAEFRLTFKNNVEKANEFLLKNFHSNFIESHSEEVTIHENESKSYQAPRSGKACCNFWKCNFVLQPHALPPLLKYHS